MVVVTLNVVVSMREHSPRAAVAEIDLRLIPGFALARPDRVDDIERESDGDEGCNKL